MKSLVAVNMTLPTLENDLDYQSDQSLIDYDIVVFSPNLPRYDRIQFSDGGSCISIQAGQRLRKVIEHWSKEIRIALETGKTVFFVLDTYESDSVAIGSTSPRKGQTQYLNKPS